MKGFFGMLSAPAKRRHPSGVWQWRARTKRQLLLTRPCFTSPRFLLSCIREFAVFTLRTLLRRGSVGFSEWGIDLLTAVVTGALPFTVELDCRAAALSVLTEACSYSVYVRFTVVAMRRSLATLAKGVTSGCRRCVVLLGALATDTFPSRS